jgi:pyridoxal phosphate enzyme (YggS family)
MPMSAAQIAAHLRENLASVRARIAAATKLAGRSDLPRLVAVTKYAPASVVRLLVAELERAGLPPLLGESRPQALWEKATGLADLPIEWHLIGHLQTNKVRRTLPLVSCVQSADSLRLLQAIDREARELKRMARVLMEINISGEAQKNGFDPAAFDSVSGYQKSESVLLREIGRLSNVQILGLMTMASLSGGLTRARAEFAALRELQNGLASLEPGNIVMRELSMGMSGDFEVAIEEGATLVRVGSALFEGIELKTNEHEAD